MKIGNVISNIVLLLIASILIGYYAKSIVLGFASFIILLIFGSLLDTIRDWLKAINLKLERLIKKIDELKKLQK